MSTRITETINARVLMTVAGVTLALFLLSGVIATAYGREPDSGVADALGTVGWFGFMIGMLLLLVLSVVSLVARVAAGRSN